MSNTSAFAVLTLFCAAICQINGQLCFPHPVVNLSLAEDATLLWSLSPNETCSISYYLVYIVDDVTIRSYAIPTTRLSLEFLPICDSFYLTVTPVSTENLEGPGSRLYAKMPFPIDADLSISSLSVASRNSSVYLEWQVPEKWTKCVDQYRFTIYDPVTDVPVDLYINNNYISFTGLVPCAEYIFGVRAIYNLETEGPFSSTRYTNRAAETIPPTLQALSLGSTTINMTWQLESYARNRCLISSISIDAWPYFRVVYPINDEPSRPPISVQLISLDPDTMYLLNVTVMNSAGRTAPTLLAVQTLES